MLTESERDCRDRYCRLLSGTLGDALIAVCMFGSSARGDNVAGALAAAL